MWILMIFLATASVQPGTHEQLMGCESLGVIDPAIRSICISPRRLETRVEKTLGGKTEGNGGCSGRILFEGTVQIYESILQLGALSQRDTFKVWWLVA